MLVLLFDRFDTMLLLALERSDTLLKVSGSFSTFLSDIIMLKLRALMLNLTALEAPPNSSSSSIKSSQLSKSESDSLAF